MRRAQYRVAASHPVSWRASHLTGAVFVWRPRGCGRRHQRREGGRETASRLDRRYSWCLLNNTVMLHTGTTSPPFRMPGTGGGSAVAASPVEIAWGPSAQNRLPICEAQGEVSRLLGNVTRSVFMSSGPSGRVDPPLSADGTHQACRAAGQQAWISRSTRTGRDPPSFEAPTEIHRSFDGPWSNRVVISAGGTFDSPKPQLGGSQGAPAPPRAQKPRAAAGSGLFLDT